MHREIHLLHGDSPATAFQNQLVIWAGDGIMADEANDQGDRMDERSARSGGAGGARSGLRGGSGGKGARGGKGTGLRGGGAGERKTPPGFAAKDTKGQGGNA